MHSICPVAWDVHLNSKYFLGENKSLFLSQLYFAFFSWKFLFQFWAVKFLKLEDILSTIKLDKDMGLFLK